MGFYLPRIVNIMLSIVVFALTLLYMYSVMLHEIKVADLLLWLGTILTVYKSFIDYRCLGYRARLLSSLSIQIVFAIIAIITRVALTLQCLARCYFLVPIIGCVYISDLTSFLGVITVYSVFVSSILSISHSLGIVLNIYGDSLPSIVNSLLNIVSKIRTAMLSHPLMVCFAIGFIARFIPELRCWPWLIGWDTIEYVAHLRDFVEVLNPFVAYPWLGHTRNLPPLFDILCGYLSMAVDPWWILKVYPALIMGFLCMLLGYIALRVFRASTTTTIMVAVATAFHIIVIGASQQWQRHMLGLTMLTLYLAIHYTKRSPVLETLALIAMAMAYEPTAVIAIILSSLMLVATWSKGRKHRLAYLLALAISIMLLVHYGLTAKGVKVYGVSIPGTVSWPFIRVALSTVKWVFIYLTPLIPAIAALYPRGPRLYTLVCLILLIVSIEPAFFPYISQLPYRWYTMLIPLLIPPALSALERFDRRAQALLLLSIVIPGAIHMYLPNTPYTDGLRIDLPPGFPWKLVPGSHIETLCKLARYVATHLTPETIIITPLGVLPFLHLEIRFLNEPRVYVGQEPLTTMLYAYNETHNYIYLVVTNGNLTKEIKLYKQTIERMNLEVRVKLITEFYPWRLYRVELVPLHSSAVPANQLN